MSSIREIHNVWRDNLVPASFRGAMFHVETSSRQGGVRTVLHQYPKRDLPYAESMGREAIKWNITGYCIHADKGAGGSVLQQVRRLIEACDNSEAGMLIHPTLDSMLVMCLQYSYTDRRERGGYFEFDMQFVEAGSPVMSQSFVDQQGALLGAASNAETTAASSIASGTQSLQQVPLPRARPA